LFLPLELEKSAVSENEATQRPSDAPEATAPPAEGAGQAAEWSPRARKAAEAVQRAEAELERAQRFYHKVREEATGGFRSVREKKVSDLVEGTLETVKKYPGPGVIVAALVGFFLGRLFRR
jgi:ElaB/YqjD/DUF883 family membrane-anchored ribosome-binding protein